MSQYKNLTDFRPNDFQKECTHHVLLQAKTISGRNREVLSVCLSNTGSNWEFTTGRVRVSQGRRSVKPPVPLNNFGLGCFDSELLYSSTEQNQLACYILQDAEVHFVEFIRGNFDRHQHLQIQFCLEIYKNNRLENFLKVNQIHNRLARNSGKKNPKPETFLPKCLKYWLKSLTLRITFFKRKSIRYHRPSTPGRTERTWARWLHLMAHAAGIIHPNSEDALQQSSPLKHMKNAWGTRSAALLF